MIDTSSGHLRPVRFCVCQHPPAAKSLRLSAGPGLRDVAASWTRTVSTDHRRTAARTPLGPRGSNMTTRWILSRVHGSYRMLVDELVLPRRYSRAGPADHGRTILRSLDDGRQLISKG